MPMYCVKCRQKKGVEDFDIFTMKNGKRAAKAPCPTCKTGMFKIGGFVDEFLGENEPSRNRKLLINVLESKL